MYCTVSAFKKYRVIMPYSVFFIGSAASGGVLRRSAASCCVLRRLVVFRQTATVMRDEMTMRMRRFN